MRIGLAIGTDDLLRAAPPRRGDRRFAGVAVRAGNIESEIGGPKIVALGLVGLECALLDLQLNVGMGTVPLPNTSSPLNPLIMTPIKSFMCPSDPGNPKQFNNFLQGYPKLNYPVAKPMVIKPKPM